MIHPLLLFAVVLLSCAATTVDAFCSSSVTFKKTTTHHDDNDIVNVGRRLLQHNVECHGNKILCMYATADSNRDDDDVNKEEAVAVAARNTVSAACFNIVIVRPLALLIFLCFYFVKLPVSYRTVLYRTVTLLLYCTYCTVLYVVCYYIS